MVLVCRQCSCANPQEAAYCYHDGAALGGRAGGPANPGSAPFAGPLVFPNGQACRNFDQLAMNCQQNWAAARDLLKQGFFASFFSGLGRVDLAIAAQEAAKFPDADRGLDQLLSKFPSQVLEPAKLQAEPSDINLGQIAVGTDRTVELHLRNLGMRLLFGSIASGCKWLALGDLPGQAEKVFQFGEEAVIAVQIRGQHLRAGTRPLEGKLVLDSNGGAITVTVRAEVPVTPFVGGAFDGATTPRHVAEKAKASPKDTAGYFESGQVAAWFQRNGWTYPVQGPAMSGMGAVQQFFEALGVAKPPQVQVAPSSLRFEGQPGKVFDVDVEVSSSERKVVYGWATSDRYWAEVGTTKLAGRRAAIPIKITVPDRKGIQDGALTVVGNGQQKFVVPVTVEVIGGADLPSAQSLPVLTPVFQLQSPAPGKPSPMPAVAAPAVIAAMAGESDAHAITPMIGRVAVSLDEPASSDITAQPDEVRRQARRSRDDYDDDRPLRRSSRQDDDDYDIRSRKRRRREDNSLSLTAMIVGIVSAALGLFGICCWIVIAPLAGMGGVAAVILGFMGKSRGGEAQATTGIILGFVAIGLSILWLFCGVFGMAINLAGR